MGRMVKNEGSGHCLASGRQFPPGETMEVTDAEWDAMTSADGELPDKFSLVGHPGDGSAVAGATEPEGGDEQGDADQEDAPEDGGDGEPDADQEDDQEDDDQDAEDGAQDAATTSGGEDTGEGADAAHAAGNGASDPLPLEEYATGNGYYDFPWLDGKVHGKAKAAQALEQRRREIEEG